MKFFICFMLFFIVFVRPVYAAEVLGVHILNTGELDKASALIKTEKTKNTWDYVTIPFTFDDIQRKAEWQRFFYQARELKFQPIVRLATRFQDGSWQIPTRKDIVEMTAVLSRMEWPIPTERIVVVFNEPNHKNEWGGTIDPEGYGYVLRFTADWLHAELAGYVVLPAGLDLAAPNGKDTLDAFTFLDRMLKDNDELLVMLDGWTSHSYPNPAFSAAPTAKGKNSLRGFEYELEYLRKYTAKEFPVYITETGWTDSKQTSRWLYQYYRYAVDHIWSDPRVRAVTPFVLNGAPGVFSQFSFYDAQGKPTLHFDAYRKALER
ncbi:MAG: hypothetical protein HZA34_04610 [Candidatus Pacebacteria bacterium]|nr:hypothetical protein [Candidatus Paceibacterota bacterium]